MARCQELAFIKRAIKRDRKRETVRISVCVPVFLTEGETDLFLSFCFVFFVFFNCIFLYHTSYTYFHSYWKAFYLHTGENNHYSFLISSLRFESLPLS